MAYGPVSLLLRRLRLVLVLPLRLPIPQRKKAQLVSSLQHLQTTNHTVVVVKVVMTAEITIPMTHETLLVEVDLGQPSIITLQNIDMSLGKQHQNRDATLT